MGQNAAMQLNRVIRHSVYSVGLLLSLSACSTFQPRAGELPFPEKPRLTWSMQDEAYCLSEQDASALHQHLEKIEALRRVMR